ncbi:efflux transporter, outer membrane factor (OMF) lipoprotein, NodT family [Solimonas aquatica]|uniref:Efflux transporter, outer membrane factor (OMF) lipoprotein, NodT family n=1 Tax=Solimonas aquatica TaxID=489703 RepID=A0A1H9BCB7_9GAMM|nr:TolC family protein [Solimonas aquatica]SEP85898.1 efflux transporter, outer membrane factor (OMF) lipoprotein, NodT family [Solimonas aquatica]
MAIILATGMLGGCVVGPDYQRPETVAPEHFRLQAAVEQRQAASHADLGQWWDGFGDLLLSRFVGLAQQQNLELAQASARVEQARAMLSMTTVELLPSAGASAQAAKAYQSVETPLGRVLNSTPGFDRHGSAYEVEIGASWELDIFGGLRRRREAAAAGYGASEAGAAATRLLVMAQTADTYITIRGLQARLKIARSQVEIQQDLLSSVRLLRDHELSADREVWQAEATLAQARASIPALESALAVSGNALDVLLGMPPGTYEAALVEPAEIPVAPRIADIGSPADVLRRRPDLAAAERQLAASNAQIGAAVAEYFPKFSLNAMIGSAATSESALLSAGSSQGLGMLGFRWRLFDFGRINAQIAAAKGRNAEMLAAYRLAVLRATEDVENAFSTLLGREQQLAEFNRMVLALDRERGASATAYEKGQVSRIELLHAQDRLLRASDARAQTQAAAALAAITTFKALGGGWESATAKLAANGGADVSRFRALD